jgi:hypothetical protein
MVATDYLGPSGESLVPAGATSKDAERIGLEKSRTFGVALRRQYYDGAQYDGRNLDRAKEAKVATVFELPEHEKLHAYSTHLQDGVDYVASQLADSFQFTASDAAVQEIILTALKASPDLRGSYGVQDISLTNMVRQAAIAQDAPYLLKWDPVRETVWLEFWDSEMVGFEYSEDDRHELVGVRVSQPKWSTDMIGEPLKKVEHQHWYVAGVECVRKVWWDRDEDAPHIVENLGIPFIPWRSLRVKRKDSKNQRGESLITEQAIAHANRYNALEQVAYLIARYNSHGNLVVVGDGAQLKAQLDERISKDVADILTFPGGTAAFPITLPTDPQMIEHQKNVLTDAMYQSFGLTRVDHETVTGLGQVSGYALEILNRKTDGTFNQIRNQFVGDFRELCNLILDMHAYKATEAAAVFGDQTQQDLNTPLTDAEALAIDSVIFGRLLTLDPMEVYPEASRQFEIHVGTGYVVDKSALRSEFTAKLISQGEYLRRAGYTGDQIKVIKEEQAADAPPAPVETGISAKGITAGTAALAAAKAVSAVVKK